MVQLADTITDNRGDPLNLVHKAFVPHVAVLTSDDTDALAREKGFARGLWQLLRPFGEQVYGKVNIRDSQGAKRSWEDFAVRFVRLGDNIEPPDAAITGVARSPQPHVPESHTLNGAAGSAVRSRAKLSDVEAVVNRHLEYAEQSLQGLRAHATTTSQSARVQAMSPFYSLYLRRLLSGMSLAPHETFAHPVACVIAISSRTESPIEQLRNLYAETSQGERRLPVWADGEYLRYYVLVHDEEKDDITRSVALFEQMKRHLGLHCHLLRLRSSQSVQSDDDSIPLPRCDWMTPAEELADICESETVDKLVDMSHYIFESDATAIRSFVREMVTQSIIPTMERHVALWNETVASRRRGITGRLVTLSKKWTGFGSSSRPSSGSPGVSSPSNYEAPGFYKPDAPEAIMRKLADFAFMLRDWRLAQSTYSLIRTDFGEAKAWRYHAAASEMTALSLLLMPQNTPSKSTIEAIDQMLDTAFYSYNTRCGDTCGALRSLTLGLELLRLRGGSSIDDAAKWGIRLLESRILGRVAEALLKEHIAVCYATKQGVGTQSWGRRRRKAALWNIMSAESWMEQSKYIQGQRCLLKAMKVYSGQTGDGRIQGFAAADTFIAHLQQLVTEKLGADQSPFSEKSANRGDSVPPVDEESEALDMPARRRRASTLGGSAGGMANLETAPLMEGIRSGGVTTTAPAGQNDFG